MHDVPRESTYPVTFRSKETAELVDNIKRKRSVELIGMKRVGISNFLRFFLHNEKVYKEYALNKSKTFYIAVDLNDLVECELYPFWLLSFKRLLDSCRREGMPEHILSPISTQFDKVIQSKDLFLTIDSIRHGLLSLIGVGYHPIFFFIGFDRLAGVITEDFFNNLRGLRDATHKELLYIFTSVRRLTMLNPTVFDVNTVSRFTTEMYLKPAGVKDMDIVLETLQTKYDHVLEEKIKKVVYERCGGHIQYLYLSIIALQEHYKKHGKYKRDPLTIISEDERVQLQSEELYSSVRKEVQNTLLNIVDERSISSVEREISRYLWNTGMVVEKDSKHAVFSPFLEEYVREVGLLRNGGEERSYLTKKEHTLFETLKEYVGEICERDTILERVWPEYQEIGVSDWAVDRLVARLRKKLEVLNSKYIVKTIRTRGFMLVENGMG